MARLSDQRLLEWYRSALRHDGWIEFVFFHGLVIIHRPPPCMPFANAVSLSAAFKARSASAQSCREQILSGYFPRPPLAGNHGSATAIVILFCLRYTITTIIRKNTPAANLRAKKAVHVQPAGHLSARVERHCRVCRHFLTPLLGSISPQYPDLQCVPS